MLTPVLAFAAIAVLLTATLARVTAPQARRVAARRRRILRRFP